MCALYNESYYLWKSGVYERGQCILGFRRVNRYSVSWYFMKGLMNNIFLILLSLPKSLFEIDVFWSSSVEKVIPRYLNGSLFWSRVISYVLWSSESVTEILLSLFVGSTTWQPLLSWVKSKTSMQHFDTSNFPLEVYSSSFREQAPCCMLLMIVFMLLFS